MKAKDFIEKYKQEFKVRPLKKHLINDKKESVAEVKNNRSFLYKSINRNEVQNTENELKIIGVSGSKGKSTVCYLLHNVLKERGKKMEILSVKSELKLTSIKIIYMDNSSLYISEADLKKIFVAPQKESLNVGQVTEKHDFEIKKCSEGLQTWIIRDMELNKVKVVPEKEFTPSSLDIKAFILLLFFF